MSHALPQPRRRLADHEVLPRLAALAARDQATTAEMLVLIGRAAARRLYATTEYPSLFRYCVGELHMSEDMAWKRIQAAKAARKFPAILAMLADVRLHLTAVVRLAPRLTSENAGDLLRAAAHLSKQALAELLAARFPRPDFSERVQALGPVMQGPGPGTDAPAAPPPRRMDSLAGLVPVPIAFASPCPGASSETRLVPEPVVPPAPVAPAPLPDLPASITPLAPGRYGVQFTFGQAAHDRLRHAQALASHAVPGGALAEIFERALEAYIAGLEKRRFAVTSRPRSASGRPGANPRHVPAAVAREVCRRDEGRCTYVSEQGRRCEAREFLQFDHVVPVAKGGQSTAANVRLRCHTHNQLEAERAFGADFMERKRAEASRRAGARQTAERAKAAERARSEAHARALAANTDAQARALEAMPWLGQHANGTDTIPVEPAPSAPA